MECSVCGTYAPPDRETGHDADRICGTCQADGWTETVHGALFNEKDGDLILFCDTPKADPAFSAPITARGERESRVGRAVDDSATLLDDDYPECPI